MARAHQAIGAAPALIAGLMVAAPLAARQEAFLTNEAALEGLLQPLNLSDSRAVFRHVFSNLPAEAVVYPSENYYYFRFWSQGRVVSGSLALPAHSRDDGVLSFSYSVRNEDPSAPDPSVSVGGGDLLTEADGVQVRGIDELAYAVSYEGRTVTFRLHVPPLDPPGPDQVGADEVYIGPVFDESGLRFHLVFDRRESHLFLFLDEGEFVPETFRMPAPEVLIGERTGFAFYDDERNRRRILIGVKGDNVLKNNWYDGPFDQMPDNYVRRGLIPGYRHFLTASYPGVRDRIDEFGNYLDREGTRVAVAPYLVYYSDEEIVSTVESCEEEGGGAAAFYACLTEQVFIVPDEKRHLVPR